MFSLTAVRVNFLQELYVLIRVDLNDFALFKGPILTCISHFCVGCGLEHFSLKECGNLVFNSGTGSFARGWRFLG